MPNSTLIVEAVKAASQADVAIVFGGYLHGYSNSWDDKDFDAEAVDKKSITLPFGQDELINAVAKANPNTIVVLLGGGAVDMSRWLKNIKAVVLAWYPGMEGGNAVANMLFGKICPSGKLPVTFPKKLTDMPSNSIGEFPGDSVVNYKEGIFVGYRHFDSRNIEPLFAFGHGLSYTKFKYSDLSLKKTDGKVKVCFTITNVGKLDGAEVAQVYVSDVASSLERPKQELKEFEKVFLKAGASQRVEVFLDQEDFQYFDDTKMQWVLEPGMFEVNVGSSSRDIKLKGSVWY